MRTTIHIDETVPANPKAVLVVNGQEMTLSQAELRALEQEVKWAVDTISNRQFCCAIKLREKYHVGHTA